MMTPMENNNTTETSETYGGVYDKTDIAPAHSTSGGPVDTAFIKISETQEVTPGVLNGSIASQDGEGDLDGFPLKYSVIRKSVRHIHRRAWSNVALAALRNVLTWACIVSLIVMMANASVMKYWSHNKIAAVVVIFSVGLLGLGFHVFRSYLDLSFKYPTVIGKLLRDAMSREEFVRTIQNRQMSPPEVAIEVALKGGAVSHESNTHWTRSHGRRTRRELSYRGWADQSAPVSSFRWPEGRSAWLVVGKDFRSLDRATKNSIESEVAEIRSETGFDSNKYFMNLEYLLQWKESDSSDDAEMVLVFEDIRPGFYSVDLYKAFTLIALDSIYRAVFHILTRNLDDYYIVKYIER